MKKPRLPKQYTDAYWAEVRTALERNHQATSEAGKLAVKMFRQRFDKGESTLYNTDPAEIAETIARQGLLIDPSKPLVPALEEIASLPKWARMAYGARCARRVEGIYRFTWPATPSRNLGWVRKAIEWAEKRAAEKIDDLVTLVDGSWAIAGAKMAAEDAWKHGARAAALSAQTAALANEEPEQACSAAAQTITFAALAGAPTHLYLRTLRIDLTILDRRVKEENWGEDTPVSPSVFGGIWPPNVTPEWVRTDIPTPEDPNRDPGQVK
jgi:hypothetical protein